MRSDWLKENTTTFGQTVCSVPLCLRLLQTPCLLGKVTVLWEQQSWFVQGLLHTHVSAWGCAVWMWDKLGLKHGPMRAHRWQCWGSPRHSLYLILLLRRDCTMAYSLTTATSAIWNMFASFQHLLCLLWEPFQTRNINSTKCLFFFFFKEFSACRQILRCTCYSDHLCHHVSDMYTHMEFIYSKLLWNVEFAMITQDSKSPEELLFLHGVVSSTVQVRKFILHSYTNASL